MVYVQLTLTENPNVVQQWTILSLKDFIKQFGLQEKFSRVFGVPIAILGKTMCTSVIEQFLDEDERMFVMYKKDNRRWVICNIEEIKTENLPRFRQTREGYAEAIPPTMMRLIMRNTLAEDEHLNFNVDS